MGAAANDVLKVDGDLTIHHAAEWKDKLLAALQAGTTALDLSSVTEMDTSGLQLLQACRRSLQQRGAALTLKTPSEAVQALCRTYGLEDWLAPPA